MYGGGMVAQMDAEKRSEQALLGERLPDATDKPDEVSVFLSLMLSSNRIVCFASTHVLGKVIISSIRRSVVAAGRSIPLTCKVLPRRREHNGFT